MEGKHKIPGYMSFIERVKGTITEPKKTMEKISQQPMIEEAVMIIGIYAILTAVMAYIVSYKFIYVFEGMDINPSSMQSLMTVSTIVFAMIGTFITWLIVAWIIHLLCMAAGGEGKFYPQILTLVGFSMLPLIFGGIISTGLLSLIEPVTINISLTNPTSMEGMNTNPLFMASGITGIIFEFWSTIILYFALLSAHKISKNSSAIIASIPLIFGIISLIWAIKGTGIL